MGEELGDHAKLGAFLELEKLLIDHLTSNGKLENHLDLKDWLRFSDTVVEFMRIRETGYNLFLDALLEGEFHLAADRHLEGLIKGRGKSLFIPMYSIIKAKGDIEIKEAPDRHGYIVRRKT